MDQPDRLGFLVGELLRGLVEERLQDDISEEKLLDCSEVSLIRA